jgi:hypothetical protein
VDEDQVIRRQRFEQDHPDIEIRPPNYPCGTHHWSAHRNGMVLCSAFELSSLLDSLKLLLRGAE